MRLRGRTYSTAVTAVIIAVGCITLVNGVRRIGQPFAGFLVVSSRIVSSIARPAWIKEKVERILWAQVVAVDGQAVGSVAEFDALIATKRIGTPVTYRFYKNAEVFSMPIEVRRFSEEDFFSLYFTFFCVGLCFALGGWYAMRAGPPWLPALQAFFAFCQLAALILFLACDLFGPRWFDIVPLQLYCLVPAALWQLTVTYPEYLLPQWGRRFSALSSYAVGIGFAWLMTLFWDDPPRVLPILYAICLAVANTLLIYFGRLAVWWLASEGRSSESRSRVGVALLGSLLSSVVPGAILVFYPTMEGTVPPVLLVGPFVFLPILTAWAIRRLPSRELPNQTQPSIQRRLTLLFLASAEMAFVAGVGVSWVNSSWEQATAAMELNHRQLLYVQDLRDVTALSAAKLANVESLVQGVVEADLVSDLRLALDRKDQSGAQCLVDQLFQHYQKIETDLESHLSALGPVDEIFFGVLVTVGIIQSVSFMLAVRRWLMQPVAQLAAATGVIATGDLTHRVHVSSSEEFKGLGDAINTMAESLAAIQARAEAERDARYRAAATARDMERQRLGRELHDGVLQDLSAIKLLLETMQRSPAPAGTLAPAIEALISVIVGLRRVVDDVAAPELARDSLPHAISTYAEMAVVGRGVALETDLDSYAPISEWATRDVYRIAQEAIANALRHGAPSRMRVSLRGNDTHVVLEVEDNGTGFDYETATLGAGIAGMSERAAAIGAHFEISAAPGKGTVVRLRSPLADASRAGKQRI